MKRTKNPKTLAACERTHTHSPFCDCLRAGGSREACERVALAGLAAAPKGRRKVATTADLFAPPDSGKVLLSYGLGVDSTAILLRWLLDPSSRDFDLKDLIVLTAMVGDEFMDEKRLIERHVLPRMREAGVRYVQVARGGARDQDGILVLSDTRSPDRLHLQGGPRRLSHEMTEAGTVPQVAGGKRRCSLKFKGWPLDRWIGEEFNFKRFRHVMGFEVNETTRVQRDRSYSKVERQSEYPLVDWGWNREACLDYIERVTGERWVKSCCTFCPFASGKKEDRKGGRLPQPVLDRFNASPEDAAAAGLLEVVALALNPRMKLYGKRSLVDAIEKTPLPQALAVLTARLASVEWGIYEVRRVYIAKGRALRSIRLVTTGTHAAMGARLAQSGTPLPGAMGVARVYLAERVEGTYPTTEHLLALCPALPKDKELPRFEAEWQKANAGIAVALPSEDEAEEDGVEDESGGDDDAQLGGCDGCGW